MFDYIVTSTGDFLVTSTGDFIVTHDEAVVVVPPPTPTVGLRTCILTRRDWIAEPITTFSNGAWVTPYQTLFDPRPQVVLQALSPDPADTRLDIDLGVQRNNIGLIHFQNLGITSMAIIRVRVGNDPTFVTNTYDTGPVSGWPQDKAPFSTTPWGDTTINGTYEPEEYVAFGMPRYFIPPSPVVGRYVRVNISDTTAAVPAQIGTIGVCETWQPLRSFDYGWSKTLVDESNVDTVPGGSRFIIPRGKRWRLNLGFGNIRQVPDSNAAQSAADLELMQKAIGWVGMMGKSRPLVIAPLPDDTPNLEKRAVYGTLVDNVTITNPYYATYSLPLVLEQLI